MITCTTICFVVRFWSCLGCWLSERQHGGCTYRSNALEDPWNEPSESMFTRSVSPEQAPDTPTYVEIEFERGDPIAIDGYRLSPATLLTRLNELAGANGEHLWLMVMGRNPFLAP